MCEPATLMAASLAISTVSAGLSIDSGRRTANQQNDALKQANDQQQMDAVRQQSQIASQGAEQMNAAALQSQADTATLDAIAGEYGGGASIDRSRAVLGLQASQSLATISGNARSRINEAGAAAHAASVRSLSQRRAIKGPSGTAAALQVGSAALDAYDRYDAARPKVNKETK